MITETHEKYFLQNSRYYKIRVTFFTKTEDSAVYWTCWIRSKLLKISQYNK